jgi:hypothetical protein
MHDHLGRQQYAFSDASLPTRALSVTRITDSLYAKVMHTAAGMHLLALTLFLVSNYHILDTSAKDSISPGSVTPHVTLTALAREGWRERDRRETMEDHARDVGTSSVSQPG